MLLRFNNITIGGLHRPLILEQLDAPSTDLRSEYTDRLNQDGSTVGRDYLGNTSWQFTVSSNTEDLSSALSVLSDLESAWKDPKTRLSTAPTRLYYSLDEGTTWSYVLGKPGKVVSATTNSLAHQGVSKLQLEFIQTVSQHFDAQEKLVSITAVQPSVSGIESPIVTPITTLSSGTPRSGAAVNTGNEPSPMKVRFFGPSTNPRVFNDKGQEIGLTLSIASDDYVTIDAQAQTVTRKNGVSVAGSLSRKTRFSQVSVPSGSSTWSYSATDPTATSRVELSWNNAYTAIHA